MPKGEGQSGKRRGPYSVARAADFGGLAPTEEDLAWRDAVLKDSPLSSNPAKGALAFAAMACRIQLRDLTSGRPLTNDEQKQITAATQKLGQTLERLKLTTKVVDDEEEA